MVLTTYRLAKESVYVNDVLIASTPSAINYMLNETGNRFKFKDLGRPKLILGLEIKYNNLSVKLHQKIYIAAMLHRY